MNQLIAIVGPTGIGKSQIALRLAQAFNGEIVGADSRQVYRHLDIGTAKPSLEELNDVQHHLIDIVNPDEKFSMAQYQRLAYAAISDIQKRGKLPFLVGGSGLYVWGVLEGWQMPRVAPDTKFRHNMERKAADNGAEKLYEELMEVDPAAAEKIDRRNVRRVIRALEVYKTKKSHASRFQSREKPPFNIHIIGLTASRAEVYRRIDLRVDDMIAKGLVNEVERLDGMGYGLDLPAMSSIGYKQIVMFLKGESTLASAAQQIKFETHRFVRHQYAWFRLKDERINWFDIVEQKEQEIKTSVSQFIEGQIVNSRN